MTQADAEDRGSADHNVELYLSGRKDDRERTDGIRHLALGVLQREAAAAERATVLSAHYVCDVLNDLLGACRGGCGDSHEAVLPSLRGDSHATPYCQRGRGDCSRGNHVRGQPKRPRGQPCAAAAGTAMRKRPQGQQ